MYLFLFGSLFITEKCNAVFKNMDFGVRQWSLGPLLTSYMYLSKLPNH